MNAMRQAHADGWFIVFDTLTLADDRLEAFYDNPNALRDYFRDIGRMVLAAEGRKANDSHADCYQYFCVPEYGTANGRLHFHFFSSRRRHPTCSRDWSSDVCSSDLTHRPAASACPARRFSPPRALPAGAPQGGAGAPPPPGSLHLRSARGSWKAALRSTPEKSPEIGRASCRERV